MVRLKAVPAVRVPGLVRVIEFRAAALTVKVVPPALLIVPSLTVAFAVYAE